MTQPLSVQSRVLRVCLAHRLILPLAQMMEGDLALEKLRRKDAPLGDDVPNCCTRTFNKYPGWAEWARFSIVTWLFTVEQLGEREVRGLHCRGGFSVYHNQCSCTIGTVAGSSIQAQEIVVSRPILSVDFPECGIPEDLLCGPAECSDSLSGLEVGDTWDCWVSNEDLISTTVLMSPWVWVCLAAGILTGVLVLLLAAFVAFTLIVPFVEDKFHAMPERLTRILRK
ncbi:hypothetical protein Pelo_10839 [Pelomyxa schiedti]|nr:hypothetical protein Pelo_10839 [Pelomyxa schiedti]